MCNGVTMVDLAQYPQLKLIAWSFPDATELEEQEAFALYERNWRFLDRPSLTDNEKLLIDYLTKECGGGLLNV